MQSRVDTTALKFSQTMIITLTLLGFILDQPYVLLFVGLVLAIGTLVPNAALFKQIYLKILRPYRLLKPNVIDDDPAPHRFAQGFGALVLLIAACTVMVFGQVGLGWMLGWVVVILAGANLFFGFCAGCFVYFQLDRVGLIPHLSRSNS